MKEIKVDMTTLASAALLACLLVQHTYCRASV